MYRFGLCCVQIEFSNIDWTINGNVMVVLHFPQATEVVMSGVHTASILAPLADVRFTTGTLRGGMYSKSLTGSGSFEKADLGNCEVTAPFIGCTTNDDCGLLNNSPDSDMVTHNTDCGHC